MQGIAAAVLLGLAAVMMVTASGMIGGFALLGALLIGAALALPIILDRVLAMASVWQNPSPPSGSGPIRASNCRACRLR